MSTPRVLNACQYWWVEAVWSAVIIELHNRWASPGGRSRYANAALQARIVELEARLAELKVRREIQNMERSG